MISIARVPLPKGTARILEKRQAKVDAADDPSAKAKDSWRTFRGDHREAVLAALREMASGLERCMYCEDSQGTAVEHFRPKASYPETSFQWVNYLLACSHCNSNEKRDKFPLLGDGRPALIDPTVTDPARYLVFSPRTGQYVARKGDIIAEKTIEVFGLNRQVCTDGRKDAWETLIDLISQYHSRQERRQNILERLARSQFQGVRKHLSTIANSPGRDRLLSEETIEAIARHPELLRA